MADENLLKMAEQKFKGAAEKIAKDLIATCYKEPQTNADRIRAMSDEELAEFLESTHTNMAIKLGGEYIVRAKEYIEIWLKQPAEE